LLAPLEDSLVKSSSAVQRIAARLEHTKKRVYQEDGIGPKQLASRGAVVALVAAIPLALIVGGPTPAKPKTTVIKKAGTTKVIRITKVVRVNENGASVGPTTTTTTQPHSRKKAATKKRSANKIPAKHVAATPPKAAPTAPVSTPEADSSAQSSDPATG
jgi:hypothetical protein